MMVKRLKTRATGGQRYLCSNVARFSGNEIISGLGDVDASDGIGVAGEEGLLSASADRPRDDARTERIERAEAIRWTEQSVPDFA